jgi:hypothetical protein
LSSFHGDGKHGMAKSVDDWIDCSRLNAMQCHAQHCHAQHCFAIPLYANPLYAIPLFAIPSSIHQTKAKLTNETDGDGTRPRCEAKRYRIQEYEQYAILSPAKPFHHLLTCSSPSRPSQIRAESARVA